MTFTVTYRGADGAVREERVEAAGRGDCFAQCRARDITPISVKEGWSGRGKTPTASASRKGDASSLGNSARPKVADVGTAVKSPSVASKTLLAAGFALAIIGGGAWWWFGRDKARPSPEPSVRAMPIKVKPTAKTVTEKPIKAETSVVTEVAKAKGSVDANEYAASFPGETITGVVTNGSGYIIVSAIGADGRRKRHVVSPPPIFESSSDEIIMLALATPEGKELPPLPDLGGSRADAEFKEALGKPILDKPDDSDDVRARKEIVRAAREEIRMRMEAGEHFADIIADHMKLRNENGEIRVRIQTELNRLVREGDEEGAKHYRDVMNTALSQMGISGIDIPDGSDDALARLRRKAVKAKGEKQ